MEQETKEETAVQETAEDAERAASKKPRERAEKADTREPAFVKELKREKKIQIKIPVNQLNAADTIVPVCINGYIYQVKRGEAVEVPQTVASLLEQGGYI